VLILSAASLTACAPGRQPLLAVTLIGAWPVAVLRMCVPGPAEVTVTENSTVTAAPSASSSTNDTGSPAAAQPTWTQDPSPTPTVSATPTTEPYAYSWSIKTTNASGIIDIPLFTTPTGWVSTANTLPRLQPGARYIADAKVGGGIYVSPVNFTTNDLHALTHDQVLYGINAPLTTVLTRADFETKTTAACAAANPTASS
jgi:hypothetical protein